MVVPRSLFVLSGGSLLALWCLCAFVCVFGPSLAGLLVPLGPLLANFRAQNFETQVREKFSTPIRFFTRKWSYPGPFLCCLAVRCLLFGVCVRLFVFSGRPLRASCCL